MAQQNAWRNRPQIRGLNPQSKPQQCMPDTTSLNQDLWPTIAEYQLSESTMERAGPSASKRHPPLPKSTLAGDGNPFFADRSCSRWLPWIGNSQQLSQDDKCMIDFLSTKHPFGTSRTISIPSQSDHIAQSEGINKLPTEIIINIFEFVVDSERSRIALLLINREWHSIMLSPTLWNTITLWVPDDRMSVHSKRLRYLKRCIQLSKRVPLNVVIRTDTVNYPASPTCDNPSPLYDSTHLPFAAVLPRCDTKRWRSLTIDHTGSGRFYPQRMVIPHLRSLKVLNNDMKFFTRSGIRDAILQSACTLLEIDLPTVVVNGRNFARPSSLGSLHIIKASVSDISCIPSLSHLQELHITTNFLGDDATPVDLHGLDSIQLPHTVVMVSCSTNILLQLQLDRVAYLTITTLKDDVQLRETAIECPKLRFLGVERHDLRSLVYISAPNLHELHIGTAQVDPATYRSNRMPDTKCILQDLPHYLKLAPRILKMRLPLTAEVTMLLLQRWPQLEQISIRIAAPFHWGVLVEGLLAEKMVEGRTVWKYGPRLKWLKLAIDASMGESGVWGRHASRILRARKGGALNCVSWTCGEAQREVFLNREG